MRNVALSILVAVASLQPVSWAAGGELGSLAQSPQPTEVLAGRVSLRLPTGAREEPLVQSVMHAPESREDQSRIVIDAGAERLIIMVYELYALTGDDLAASLQAELARLGDPDAKGYRQERLALEDSRGQGFTLMRTAPPSVARAAIHLGGMFLGLPDGTAVLLQAFVNPEGFQDPEGAASIARRIFASGAAGPRQLSRAPGPRGLGQHLALTLPPDVIVVTQSGPDFSVYRLFPLRRLGERVPGQLGIYVGHHASFRPIGRPSPGTLLGRSVVWYDKSNSGTKALDVLVTMGVGRPEEVAHMFVSAPDDDALQFLKAIAETLTMAPVQSGVQPD